MTLYKTVVVYTVLSDEPITADWDIASLVRECDTGGFSGDSEIGDSVEIGRKQMAVELRKQHSDPSFLLGENGWKFELGNNDQTTIETSDGPKTITIQNIEIVETENSCDDDFVTKITDKDGNYYECLLSDLS